MALILVAFLLTLIGATHGDKSCHDNGPQDCPENDRMAVLESKLDLVRLQFRGLLSECNAQDPYLEIPCDPVEPVEYFTVAVTGEGGNPSGRDFETSKLNKTSTLFQINDVPAIGVNDWSRGLKILTLSRTTQQVYEVKNFDIWGGNGTQEEVAAFIQNTPDDSIFLVSVIGIVAQVSRSVHLLNNHEFDLLWKSLNSIGLYKRFYSYDSYAGIGFKAAPGLCDRVPDFVVQSYELNPGVRGRGGLWSPPVTVRASIPTKCDQYSTDTDFHVQVVSESDQRGLEYAIDGPDSSSLFLVNGKRIFDVTWARGLNVVILDPKYRTASASKHFDTFADTGEADKFVDFIDSQSDGSIVLVSAINEAGFRCHKECNNKLVELGFNFQLAQGISKLGYRQSMTLITMKGLCPNGKKPTWMRQGWADNPKNSRKPEYGYVVSTGTTITVPLCG